MERSEFIKLYETIEPLTDEEQCEILKIGLATVDPIYKHIVAMEEFAELIEVIDGDCDVYNLLQEVADTVLCIMNICELNDFDYYFEDPLINFNVNPDDTIKKLSKLIQQVSKHLRGEVDYSVFAQTILETIECLDVYLYENNISLEDLDKAISVKLIREKSRRFPDYSA